MREVRIYHSERLVKDQEFFLSLEASHHIAKVLRMKEGQPLTLFNGTSQEFSSTIIQIDKKQVKVLIEDCWSKECESPIKIHLGQVISRGDKMEFTIQKAVELGVSEISPLYSERCGVKLDKQREEKKIQQWEKIIISACEQCGRTILPKLNPIRSLAQFCQNESAALRLTLHPRAEEGINNLILPSENPTIDLLIGSEGGLTDEEIGLTVKHNFKEIILGPRVLRTETAALTAISALQLKLGDLG
ncbi:16S rRNA (uracil(1498)-N(3))-methyltransferase [Thorsellia kenyensis]|uniref:Ribosomal RNA small subunit methyltransferase E n=1 Tax=Thorsellia kenyensis TaxID=1549888 RepID=A0ABV6CDI7_9GAMM